MDSADCKQICKEWTKTTSNNNNDIECDKICIEIFRPKTHRLNVV